MYQSTSRNGLGSSPAAMPSCSQCSSGFSPAAATAGLRARYQVVSNQGLGWAPVAAPVQAKCAAGSCPAAASSGCCCPYHAASNSGVSRSAAISARRRASIARCSPSLPRRTRPARLRARRSGGTRPSSRTGRVRVQDSDCSTPARSARSCASSARRAAASACWTAKTPWTRSQSLARWASRSCRCAACAVLVAACASSLAWYDQAPCSSSKTPSCSRCSTSRSWRSASDAACLVSRSWCIAANSVRRAPSSWRSVSASARWASRPVCSVARRPSSAAASASAVAARGGKVCRASTSPRSPAFAASATRCAAWAWAASKCAIHRSPSALKRSRRRAVASGPAAHMACTPGGMSGPMARTPRPCPCKNSKAGYCSRSSSHRRQTPKSSRRSFVSWNSTTARRDSLGCQDRKSSRTAS